MRTNPCISLDAYNVEFLCWTFQIISYNTRGSSFLTFAIFMAEFVIILLILDTYYTQMYENPGFLSHGKRKKKKEKENFRCCMITEVVEKSGTYKFLLSISPNGALNITFITWFQFKHSWCNLMLGSMQITWGQSINFVKLITFETAIYWYNWSSHSQFTEKTKKRAKIVIVQGTDANVTSILEEGVDAHGHHHQCHWALGEAGCGCACGVGAHWR